MQANVEAIGDLFLELNNGFVLRLKEVFYISSLRQNLISVLKLDDDRTVPIFVMANVRYLLMMNVLVLPSDKTSFIYYLLLIM